MKLCEYVVSTYINTAFSEANVNNKDKEILIRFIKCECFGLVIEWLNSGMPDDAINDLLRITELCKGLSEELIRRSQNV